MKITNIKELETTDLAIEHYELCDLRSVQGETEKGEMVTLEIARVEKFSSPVCQLLVNNNGSLFEVTPSFFDTIYDIKEKTIDLDHIAEIHEWIFSICNNSISKEQRSFLIDPVGFYNDNNCDCDSFEYPDFWPNSKDLFSRSEVLRPSFPDSNFSVEYRFSKDHKDVYRRISDVSDRRRYSLNYMKAKVENVTEELKLAGSLKIVGSELE